MADGEGPRRRGSPPQQQQQQQQQQQLLILDGGTGHLLKQWGAALPGLPVEQQFLAGVAANETDPQLVVRAHREYVAAGADVITTNSFSATAHSLAKIGRPAAAAPALARAAARNAAAARAAAGRAGEGVLIAGSLPPLKESYQSDGLCPHDEAVQQYRDLAEAMAPHVDLFLAETLAAGGEAEAAAEATATLGKPLWVSFTLEDSPAVCLRSGEPLAGAARPLLRHPHLRALLLNCCAPGAVAAALPALRAAAPPAVRVGAYANGFRTTTSEWLAGGGGGGGGGGDGAARLELDPREYDAQGLITPEAYARHAVAWARAGASVVGGCCGVGPAHIAAVAAALGRPPKGL
ncbi:hypothetical protein Rsub_12724 [Raphidocelis subcapitata]|uniref:Hcy-binding domain-containing protein n=1 Tax=Raphidocelis subcapitata TaxID=307507 RepID=A0A2V0PR19_9CHLO|nr:hypothetical protein Rsub_12724 [Raphidocelis subcapitata]|eukprot:GBF99997.1 hypothetical protein Rsub_12724 [Raphidocelis subcapitata]